jgi:hypothetical protein
MFGGYCFGFWKSLALMEAASFLLLLRFLPLVEMTRQAIKRYSVQQEIAPKKAAQI